MVFPLYPSCCRLDSDTPFPLQFHVIHSRPDPVLAADFVNSVDLIAVKQYTLGKRRFSRINMCAYAYIPHLLNVDAHSAITLLYPLNGS
jgi:hypothetical protein